MQGSEEKILLSYIRGGHQRVPIDSNLSNHEKVHLHLISEQLSRIGIEGLTDRSLFDLRRTIQMYKLYLNESLKREPWLSLCAKHDQALQKRVRSYLGCKNNSPIKDDYLSEVLAHMMAIDRAHHEWRHTSSISFKDSFSSSRPAIKRYRTFIDRPYQRIHNLASIITQQLEQLLLTHGSEHRVSTLMADELQKMSDAEWHKGVSWSGMLILCPSKTYFSHEFYDLLLSLDKPDSPLISQTVRKWRQNISIDNMTKLNGHTIDAQGLENHFNQWLMAHEGREYTSKDIHDCYTMLSQWPIEIQDDCLSTIKCHIGRTLRVDCAQLDKKMTKQLFYSLTQHIEKTGFKEPACVIAGDVIYNMLSAIYNLFAEKFGLMKIIVIQKKDLTLDVCKTLSTYKHPSVPPLSAYHLRSRVAKPHTQLRNHDLPQYQQHSSTPIAVV